jgi:hypothetical protein
MKKNYVNPELELIGLETIGFLAASVPGAEGGGSDGGLTPSTDDPSDPNWGSDF